MRNNIQLKRNQTDQRAARRVSDDSPQAGAGPAQDPTTSKHQVTIRLDEVLFSALENMIEASNLEGDYSINSVSEIIRRALRAHHDGMRLAEPALGSPRKRFTIGMDAQLKEFYDSLPHRRRTEIIERSVRTFLSKDDLDGTPKTVSQGKAGPHQTSE